MKDGSNLYLKSAEYLKSQLIDFFILQMDDILIGNEVMYGVNRRVVDMLVVNGNNLIAVEIKGENDDLRRIQEQVEEYKKIFDYIIVCTVKAHLDRLVKITTTDIGIYILTEGRIQKVRKPKKQYKQDKFEMLYTMNSKYLRTVNNIKSQLNSDEIRVLLAKKSSKEIKHILCEYFSGKIEKRYKLFIADRGIKTHIDDIPLLSSNTEIL